MANTPKDEFNELFPTADVHTSEKLRYNGADVPVEAFRVFGTLDEVTGTYEGEIISVVSDPANNGMYHILSGVPRRIGFVY